MNIVEAIKASPYKNIFVPIDGVYFPLDPNWKKISINLSGGADSAILSFLICKELVERKLNIDVYIISNIRMWKLRPWQRHNSLNVFNFLKNKFPSLTLSRYENFIPPDIEYGNIGPSIKDEYGNMKSGDQIATRSFVEYFAHVHAIDAHYAGLSKNPDDPKITLGMSDRNISFKSYKDLDLILSKYDNFFVCHPFRFVTKEWIIKQYKDLDLLDFLNITRSCEGDSSAYPETFKDLNYKTYKQNMDIPKCGKCFWCQERSWAEDINNIKCTK